MAAGENCATPLLMHIVGSGSPEQQRSHGEQTHSDRRWRRRARQEVKEAAPPEGLCLLRVGYEETPFPRTAWYDSQPQFRLELSDPPPLWSPDAPGGSGGRP
jgi:hypothetical protein